MFNDRKDFAINRLRDAQESDDTRVQVERTRRDYIQLKKKRGRALLGDGRSDEKVLLSTKTTRNRISACRSM